MTHRLRRQMPNGRAVKGPQKKNLSTLSIPLCTPPGHPPSLPHGSRHRHSDRAAGRGRYDIIIRPGIKLVSLRGSPRQLIKATDVYPPFRENCKWLLSPPNRFCSPTSPLAVAVVVAVVVVRQNHITCTLYLYIYIYIRI